MNKEDLDDFIEEIMRMSGYDAYDDYVNEEAREYYRRILEETNGNVEEN